MTFIGIFFGLSALVLFLMAFSNVFKGRMGQAAAFGIMAVLMSALASGLIYYGD